MALWDVMKNWFGRILYGGGLAAGGLVGAALGLLYLFQEKLIYLPRIPGVPDEFAYLPDKLGLAYEDVWITTKDGTKLHAWLMWPQDWTASTKKSRPIVIFFQENAGNMSLRLPFLRMLVRFLNCAVFAPSYRGYGLSQGVPTEAGLKQDAQAALDHVTQRQDVNTSQVSLFGRSLGGAVAIHLAAANRDRVHSLMIENTFTSIEEVAPKVMPILSPFLGPNRPFNCLIRNKWNNLGAIASLDRTPLLLMSSTQDEMLPPSQMTDLYEAVGGAASTHCTFVTFPAAHMDAYEVCRHAYWPAMMKFLDDHSSTAAAGNGVGAVSSDDHQAREAVAIDEDDGELIEREDMSGAEDANGAAVHPALKSRRPVVPGAEGAVAKEAEIRQKLKDTPAFVAA